MAVKELGDRKMAKTVSLKGSTIMKLEEIASKSKGESSSSVIANLIEKEHSSLFPAGKNE